MRGRVRTIEYSNFFPFISFFSWFFFLLSTILTYFPLVRYRSIFSSLFIFFPLPMACSYPSVDSTLLSCANVVSLLPSPAFALFHRRISFSLSLWAAFLVAILWTSSILRPRTLRTLFPPFFSSTRNSTRIQIYDRLNLTDEDFSCACVSLRGFVRCCHSFSAVAADVKLRNYSFPTNFIRSAKTMRFSP